MGGAELCSDAGGSGRSGAAMRILAGSERGRDSAPVTAKYIAGSRVYNIQEVTCG